LNFTREFRLSYEGRAYVVDQIGRLISAADVSLVLQQISFANRPLIRQLIDPKNPDFSLVEGDYANETGARMVATGLRFARPQWALVIEQPESLLFAPIRQKIWFFLSLSLIGLISSFVLAQSLSRRFTKPIITLREGAEQVGSGNLEHRVSVETDDEIGELAAQFNRMADHLRSSQQATLSALTIPIISQTSELQEVLTEVLTKVIKLTGAEAASIRLVDEGNKKFGFSVYQGFSEAYVRERSTTVREEAEAAETLKTGRPFISGSASSHSSNDRLSLVTEGFKSAVYLPLKTPKMTFGIMTIANRDAAQVTPRQVDLLTAITHQISVALQNATLFEETERNLRRTGALYAIVLGITSSLNLRSVLDVLLKKIDLFLPYPAVTISLLNRQTGRLEPEACRNIDETEWKAVVGSRSSRAAFVPDVAPLIVPNIQANTSSIAPDFFRRQGLASFVQLPLVAKDEVLGVITFFRKEEHEFTGEEVEFLSTLAGQAAIAICNAQLYERSTEQAVELERASKLQADFSAMIVHDLRSPLSTIMGIAEMMGDGLLGNLNDDQKNWTDRIKKNATGLVALVSDFLDLSKLEAGRIELSRVPTDVTDLLRKEMENFGPLARSKNIVLSCQADPLPAVQADSRRLDQVLK